MTVTDLAPRRGAGFTEAERRAQRVLQLLSTWSGRTDDDIASDADMKRESFRQRRTGVTRIRRGEEDQLARALKVAPECFAMTDDELYDWVRTDERGRTLLIALNRCILLLAS